MTEYYLDASLTHAFWDNDYPARLAIKSGDTVHFECQEATGGQLTPESTHADLEKVDSERIHALTGPVFIEGARPGDILIVEILALKHKGWGWNSHMPGFGLLAEDFDFHYLQHWRLDGDSCFLRGDPRVELPFEPFCGVMGVAPREDGRIDTIPPRFNGGNVDIRGLTIGATVYLPVQADGALFSTADCHAAQGDGEVGGAGIESPMTVTLRFSLDKTLAIRELQFRTPSPLTRADSQGYYATTAHGPDLYANAQNAVRYVIDWLMTKYGFDASEAYCLCSVAADLKLSELVDKPNWIVSCYFPLSVLRF